MGKVPRIVVIKLWQIALAIHWNHCPWRISLDGRMAWDVVSEAQPASFVYMPGRRTRTVLVYTLTMATFFSVGMKSWSVCVTGAESEVFWPPAVSVRKWFFCLLLWFPRCTILLRYYKIKVALSIVLLSDLHDIPPFSPSANVFPRSCTLDKFLT